MKLTILFLIAATFIAVEAVATIVKKEIQFVEDELSGKAFLPGQCNMISTYADRGAWW